MVYQQTLTRAEYDELRAPLDEELSTAKPISCKRNLLKSASRRYLRAWKAKYGGVDVSEAQEVKQLREENALLKKLVA